MTLQKTYTCLLCKKDIDDYGDNFCSKCRNKPWQQRFNAIAKAEKIRNQMGHPQISVRKTSGFLIDHHQSGPYWSKRREE